MPTKLAPISITRNRMPPMLIRQQTITEIRHKTTMSIKVKESSPSSRDRNRNLPLCLFDFVTDNPFVNLLNQQAPNMHIPLGGATLPQASPFNAFMMPPFGFMPGPPPPPPAFLFQAPPVPPPSFDHLTDEQLQLLEGTERRNVEERIKVCIVRSHSRSFPIPYM